MALFSTYLIVKKCKETSRERKERAQNYVRWSLVKTYFLGIGIFVQKHGLLYLQFESYSYPDLIPRVLGTSYGFSMSDGRRAEHALGRIHLPVGSIHIKSDRKQEAMAL